MSFQIGLWTYIRCLESHAQYFDPDEYEIYDDPKVDDGQFVIRLGPLDSLDENVFTPEENKQLEELFQLWPSWEAFDKAGFQIDATILTKYWSVDS